MTGRFIAVVGPSGVGKDSVMEGLCAKRPDLVRARRTITRDPDAGCEAFDGVSRAAFAQRAAAGAFALQWQAHGLCYGIPVTVHAVLRDGRDVLANLSRGVLVEASDVFDRLLVLHVTAQRNVLASRLLARGRETETEVARRLARPALSLPETLKVIDIDNSGSLQDAVSQADIALYPLDACARMAPDLRTRT
ncbi:MAG: phosphonate metabolism protein/1,5-bisphosphokinase (PRPP-forming) PhnN [Pseudomonadota bacterium]